MPSFSEFCKMTSRKNFGYRSQQAFLADLFKAANFRGGYSDSYLRSLYNGHKPFSSAVREQFAQPVNKTAITEFFKSHLQEDSLTSICNVFGIPLDWERDATYLAAALAEQFFLYITIPEESVKLCVRAAYDNARNLNERSDYRIGPALYDGDYVDVEKKSHSINCYERFTHTWIIYNRGKTLWTHRKLVCVKPREIPLVISDTVIDLPEVLPGGYTKIATDINARGCEGHYVSKWEMQDASDKDCFPGSSRVFDITIDVIFDPDNDE